MDNIRLFLWLGLAFVAYLMYSQWLKDYRVPPPAAPTEAAAPAATPALPGPSDLPELPTGGDASSAPATTHAASPALEAGRRVRVRTDVLDLDISTIGGDLRRLELPDYPVKKDQPGVPIRLLDDSREGLFIFQSGVGAAGQVAERLEYTAVSEDYELAAGEDTLSVVLTWRDGARKAAKTFTFTRGSYEIDVTQEIENTGSEPWQGVPYVQLKRRHVPVDRSFTSVESYSFRGPVFFDGKKYEKLKIKDLRTEPLNAILERGWIASIQHHFLAAAVPDPTQKITYAGRVTDDDIYLLTAIGPVQAVAPGATEAFAHTLFVGPKLQSQLRETADGLVLTVDYGFLTILSQPLFWLLSKIHGIVGNWGWAIIFLTILIKLLFYKLSETSGHSMAKMRKLQPRMKALQERYKDDREQLSRAMMELYKKEGANPMAGCLPILVQMPVFLALYWVLLESVEMRQAPFMLWINDLSSRDPYFILPVAMGVTMFAQQKLNPAPPDPVQARVMMILPLVFTVFFAFFPAGLVLYWFMNNLLSIAQQWRINRVVERKA